MIKSLCIFQKGVGVKVGEGGPYLEITMEGSESQGKKYRL